MKPFRERNPIPIGIIGVIVTIALLLVAFNAKNLPIIGGGDDYKAAFSELGGLRKDDPVRIAGVKVGTVQSVALQGNRVLVGFRLDKGTPIGDRTSASIRIATLLGQKYLALDPDGTAAMRKGATIPLDRTTPPFDVPAAFTGLAQREAQIDTKQLAAQFQTLADTFKDTPDTVKATLTGLSRLSQTIASRDQQLSDLLAHTRGVTQVLADRREDLSTIIKQGDLVLQVLDQRREAIHRLLVGTSTLSAQLTGLVRDNQAQIGPTLARLRAVVAILQKNQTNLDNAIQLAAPFAREFTDTVGNGRWFDTIVSNLPSGATDLQVKTGSIPR